MGYELTSDIRPIAKMAWKFWYLLPKHVQVNTDPEDLIQGALVAIVTQVVGGKYDSARGAPSTFVCTLAHNHFVNLLHSYELQKRKATGMVELEEWNGSLPTDEGVSWMESRKAVEALLRDCSDGLKRALDGLITKRRYRFSDAQLDELRMLVVRNGVRRSDFDAVLRVV